MNLIDTYYKMPYFVRYPAFLVKGAIQAHQRYGGHFREIRRELDKNLSMGTEEIHALQLRLLQNLIRFAYEQVPYYKRTFRGIGFEPGDLKSIKDLSALPILTKEDVRSHFTDLQPINTHSASILHTTGGTTSAPLRFLLPKELKGPFNYATLYRFYSWAGVKFGQRRVSVAGRMTTKRPPFAMINTAENQLYVCAHHLQPNNLRGIVESIRQFCPVFMQGHPSAISIIAEYVLEFSTPIPIKAVFTTSENLYPEQRQIIKKAFGCEVFDTYGMGEMVAMASECTEHNGYHLAPEYGITEVVNQDQYFDGIGELVSTSLQNYTMPLIRYKCGDLGSMSDTKCACGNNFPRLSRISGRIDDVIQLPNGEKILPLSIRIQMKNAGIDDFQLILYEDKRLTLNLLSYNTNKSKETALLLLRQIFGSYPSIEVMVNAPPILSRAGKRQMIIHKKGTT